MALIHGSFKVKEGEYRPQEINVDSFGNIISSSLEKTVSQGGYQSIPTNSTNGTELPNRPNSTSGVRFELNTGATVVYFIAPTGTNANNTPSFTKTLNIAGTTDEPLAGTDSLFVVSSTGTLFFRWILK